MQPASILAATRAGQTSMGPTLHSSSDRPAPKESPRASDDSEPERGTAREADGKAFASNHPLLGEA